MRRVVAFLVMVCTPLLMGAQSSFAPLVIDNQTAQQHLLEHPNVGIPPIAKAAHVVGDVDIQVTIDTNGHVVGAVVLSGPPMLTAAGRESVREWRFAPFGDGQPVIATTVVKLSYTERTPLWKHRESSDLKEFYLRQAECSLAMQEAMQPGETAKRCGRSAKLADGLQTDKFRWEQSQAYIDAAHAYVRNNEPDEALAEADKAVALVKSGWGDSHSIALAYISHGLAESQLHKGDAADADFAMAEQAERGAVATIQSESMKKSYTAVLKYILQSRAQLLNGLHRPDEAKAKSDEAARL